MSATVKAESAVELSSREWRDLILREIELIQSRLDKYDRIFWQNRGWMITMTVALIGWGVTTNGADQRTLLSLASVVPVLFWIHEALTRFDYWYKYVARYRALRDALNSTRRTGSTVDLVHFDLGHSAADPDPLGQRLKACALKREPLAFYALMLLLTLVAHWQM